MIFYTIGVYNSSEHDFFDKIVKNGIELFCDIRQRRGVRGAKYAFVNSKRLQGHLLEMGVRYEHVFGLAPSKEIRKSQKDADLFNGELKYERKELGQVFRSEYKKNILDAFNLELFIENLENNGVTRIAFFCVEEIPQACHRSIVTDKLEQLGYKIIHL